jgi:uncharacterized protein YdeI (YjbR/CyaY-like superfamily)
LKKYLYTANRKDWRQWLKKNHANKSEIWLVYYKKHTGKERITYNDAVEEALCFGWIDSIIGRIDDEKYAQKFTPRKDKSNWSESNKKRVKALISQKKMTEAGLVKIKKAKETGKWDKGISFPEMRILHPDFKNELDKNPKAKENFEHYAPSYKKNIIGWISAAKKEETRFKRIREAIGILEKNQKLGLK